MNLLRLNTSVSNFAAKGIHYIYAHTKTIYTANTKKKKNAKIKQTVGRHERFLITARRALHSEHCTANTTRTYDGRTRAAAMDFERQRRGTKKIIKNYGTYKNVTHQTTVECLTIKLADGRMRAPGETRFSTVAQCYGQAR